MNFRIAALVCAVLALSSTAWGQDPRNKAFVEQQLKIQRMKQAGLITDAQAKALELKALQQLRGGQGGGPKTGFDPSMQGGMPMMAPQQQPPKESQADKNRATLKKRAEAKKAQKKDGKKEKADDAKANEKKAEKDAKPQKK